MLIESVKRWVIIILMIAVALLALVIMAQRIDVQSAKNRVAALEQSNQVLFDAAKSNADQVKAMATEANANDALDRGKQKAKASASERARSNTYAVHKALSTESCATVRMPAGTISMLRSSGGNKDPNILSNSASSTDP